MDILNPPPIYEPNFRMATETDCSSNSSLSSFSVDKSELNSLNSPDYFEEYGSGESLPDYSPAFTKKGVLQIKPELSSPFCRASRRNWRTAYVEVNNTQIKITQSEFYRVGMLKRTVTYSLQFAEVGLASDYMKRPHCFRLRIETKQFVFDCKNRQEMLAWMVGLQMAISLALPLELRQLPEESRRRYRRNGRERRRRAERQSGLRGGSSESADRDENSSTSRRDRRRQSHNEDNRTSRGHGEHQCMCEDNRQVNTVKWQPRRRQSRFNEKDFPHLLMNSSWEGKSILYRGRWAFVHNKQIILVLSGISSLYPPDEHH